MNILLIKLLELMASKPFTSITTRISSLITNSTSILFSRNPSPERRNGKAKQRQEPKWQPWLAPDKGGRELQKKCKKKRTKSVKSK